MVPDVTIIIPTCNRPEALAACLRLLAPQIPSDGSVELVVCDDSVAMETRDMLRRDFPSVVRICGSRGGPGANRNIGARSARGKWLLFFDDDVLPHPGLLVTYRAAFACARKAGCILVGETIRSGENPDSLLWEAPHYAGTGVLPPSCNFAIPRDVFCAHGGFDERFRYSFEDMEFFARLTRAGVPVLFLEDAAVDHPARPLPSAAILARRWEARVISAYDSGATAFGLLWRLPRHVFMVILSRFRGRKPDRESIRAAGLFAAELFIVMFHLPGWLLKYRALPLSSFWVGQVAKGEGLPKFGL